MVEAGARTFVAKVGPGADDEAEGLRALAAVPSGPPVPDIVVAEADLLVSSGGRAGSPEGRARGGVRT